jgi:hypothetical protein
VRPRINYRNTQQLLSILCYPGFMAITGLMLITQPSWHSWVPAIFLWLLIPVCIVAGLIRSGFVDSIFLEKRGQRTLVYATASLCAGVLLAQPSDSYLENRWKCAVFFVLLGLGLVNAFRHKISAHGAGVAGFLALSLHLYLQLGASCYLPATAMGVCALIYWARLQLSAHSHFELITGFALGFFTTFVLILWT